MTAMNLHVAGVGLVSPVASTAREHVFFIRAEAGMTGARAFVDATGEPLDVMHCQRVDPTLPRSERLIALGALAIEDACSAASNTTGVAARLVMPEPWDAFTEDDAARCEAAWGERFGLVFGERLVGAASPYEALAEVSAHGATLMVGLESFASAEAIAARLREPSRWEPVPPRLSEAAAAVLVTDETHAAAMGETMARILFAATEQGAASDLDDEPVRGRAMTSLLRMAAAAAPSALACSFGPHTVDELRRVTWHHAVVRNYDAFLPAGDTCCVEHSIGRVGAASGLCHLVYAVACLHHGVLSEPGPLPTWAVSRDGMCGLGVVTR